ncbi:MAG: ABC transporter permease [Chloroflexota bacterium]|nr:MAG: ABC transporter permease [Chloroflexota bacterium]
MTVLDITQTSGTIESTSSRLRKAGYLSPVFLISSACILAMVFAAILADWLMPHDPLSPDLSKALMPPFWQDGGSLSYPLGTDTLGRDMLSRLILGARVSLVAAVSAIFVAGAIGVTLGIMAGYFGGLCDSVIMRLADGMLSLPIIFLALILGVVYGPSLANVVLVIVLLLWARFARVIRAEVLSWKTRDFVNLARVAGASPWWVMWNHIFPNVVNTAIVLGTLQVGTAIMLEAALSFLGVGIPAPAPSWGGIAATGRNYVTSAWWLSTFPGIAIMIIVLATNLLGDWVRDTLDPQLRQL